MESALHDFREEIKAGCHLALMPVSRFRIERPFWISPFVCYPQGEVDLEELRTVPNHSLSTGDRAAVTILGGQELRESLTSLTGASISELRENTLITFPTKFDWNSFLRSNHKQDIELIRKLSERAERAMGMIRFEYCRFDLPDTLPGRIGQWDQSGQYSCALVFTAEDHESYLIAGAAVHSSIVVRGLGLELDDRQCGCSFPLPEGGEVGSIARHGLSLFSDVMEANSATTMFLRAMTLLEYLAAPDEYRPWQKAKTELLPHFAKSKTDYHRLCERFRQLSSTEVGATVPQLGLRTLIVHHGRYLEEILPDNERDDLFRELQEYTFPVLRDMLERPMMTWEQFTQYRASLRARLGV